MTNEFIKRKTARFSSRNSSDAPLAAGATFTGTADINDHPDVMVSCLTDASGTMLERL